MLPLVVYVEIPYYDNVFVQVDSSSPPIQAIQQKYDVTFIVKGVGVLQGKFVRRNHSLEALRMD